MINLLLAYFVVYQINNYYMTSFLKSIIIKICSNILPFYRKTLASYKKSNKSTRWCVIKFIVILLLLYISLC